MTSKLIACKAPANKAFNRMCCISQGRMKGKSETPHTRTSSDENYLESIFGSVSHCVVILRMTPHWSVKMTSRNLRLLTVEQQIKVIMNFK